MSVRAKRFLALVAVIAATGVSALSLAPNAQAAPCGSRAGVTIIVEYGDPVGTLVGCATGDPATGLEALKISGYRYTFVPRQPGFVCTIDARPNPCNNGPANAYWSYWPARPGGSWSYGSIGAGLLPRARGRAELGLLAAYGGVSALAYGLLLNLTFWPFSVGAGTHLSFVPGAALVTNAHHFLLFSVGTSLGWDLGRALTNVVLILLTGHTVLGALRRAARRAAFTASADFEPGGPALH